MKLSVVIPCFNEVATIDRIADAVRSSPHPDTEIIVVDGLRALWCIVRYNALR